MSDREETPVTPYHLVKIDDLLAGVTTSAEDAKELIRRYLVLCWPSVDQSKFEEHSGADFVDRYYPTPDAPSGYVQVSIVIRPPWTPAAKWPAALKDMP